MPIARTRYYLSLLALATLVGCHSAPLVEGDPALADPEELTIVEQEAPPASTAGRTSPRRKAPALVSSDFLSRSAAAPPGGFAAHGLAIDADRYRDGYERFLNGRAASPVLENQYRLLLEEQLLVAAGVLAGTSEPLDSAGQMQVLAALADTTLERWPDGRPIRESDLRSLYEMRADRYLVPERAQVRIILVPTREEAEGLLPRLESEPFGEVAATESRHASRSRFGELDPFPRGTYSPEFEALAFRLKPGEIDLVETSAGTFIIQKIAALSAEQRPFDEVRGELLLELRRSLRQDRAESLRTKAPTN